MPSGGAGIRQLLPFQISVSAAWFVAAPALL
jgi:hypothetical protein